LAEILGSSARFEDKVASGEAYFRANRPGISFKNLSSGPDREGEYVKFMRWQQYWKNSLNADGTLGDVPAYGRNKLRQKAAGGMSSLSQSVAENLYQSVNWTNLSCENYIGTQIGLGRTTSMAFHPANPNIFF
jgi:hypothetical protein